MDYQLNTRLNGNIAMTSRFHENKRLQRDKTLYKFLWVQNGSLAVEVDHIPMRLAKDEIITLTPLHHLEVKEVEGEYLTLVFNSNFYCIFGHDDEVSCNGVLFYGSSQVMRLELSEEQSSGLHDIVRGFCRESAISDSFQEEMLRIMLKRFIITCTRIARTKFSVGREETEYRQDYAPEVLEAFDNKHPGNDYWVRFNCPEFTSLCPITGQPDFAEIRICYIPDVKMVESKSLKLYLFSFRNHGAFHEDCVNIIMKDLIHLMNPKYIEVTGIFTPRGGISIYPYANYGRPGTKFEQMAEHRLMNRE